MEFKIYDNIVIGAGLYGLYSALYLGKTGRKVIILECDNEAFGRATYVNQARVHNGYHYPRSLSTAIKSAKYFDRFNNDFSFSILKEFDQIYATSSDYSWTNAKQFIGFCKASGIPCEEVNPNKYFNNNKCDGAFKTIEYTYDAMILRDYFVSEIKKYSNIIIEYNSKISKIYKDGINYCIEYNRNEKINIVKSKFILNATYASTNQIIEKLNFEGFNIKYELCEIILVKPNNELKNIGLTVMDGPFFSIMPFGKTGLHSLTSVTFTPHVTSYDKLPTYLCQNKSLICNSRFLDNCNLCEYKPKSAYEYMNALAKKYIKSEYKYEYLNSLYSVKPILMSSEADDSRPTVIKVFSKGPTFISVLSGKINTIYDLDEVLDEHG